MKNNSKVILTLAVALILFYLVKRFFPMHG